MSTPQKKKKASKAKDSEPVSEPVLTTHIEETIKDIVEPIETIQTETINTIIEENTTTTETAETIDNAAEIVDSQQIIEEIKKEIEMEIREKIDEVITVKIPVNLVDLVKEEIKQKTHILNKEYIDILNSLVYSSPHLLNDIEKAMFEIMKDGKIDSNDIPYLITIIQKLYEFLFSLKIKNMSTEKRASICAEVIKFVVMVLIKERRIKVDASKQEIFIGQFNALMDSCVTLLSLQSGLISKGCCFCFGKK